MTWLRRARPALFVLGGLLVIASLLGARLLAGGDQPKTANPANGQKGSGPVVIGWVDSDPPPVAYGLPAVMQSGQVVQVFVKEGDHVEKDAPLFQFDSSTWERKLATTQNAVAVAQTKVKQAKELETQHKNKIILQNQKVKNAEEKVNRTKLGWEKYGKALREGLLAQHGSDTKGMAIVEQQMDINPELFKVETEYRTAVQELEWEKAAQKVAEATDPRPAIAEAEAGVKQAEAVRDEAAKAVEMCTVRAKSAGTVEQINVSAGTTLGISSRVHALWLVPDGPRVVRAEIEADFAHRVSPNLIGRPVTIYDHTDPKLTYKGKLVRISGSFLPKRTGGENLLGNDTKVLEAVVEVTDPAPSGLPPLRVGQKVKVDFGQ